MRSHTGHSRLTETTPGAVRLDKPTGQSVLLVEQNVHHSLRLIDRVHVLENGRVVRSGVPAELEKTGRSSKPVWGVRWRRGGSGD
jgi:ABC-type branched-subunit amino acid transport system ATPase component